jgi:outer membrane protein assembly factor BamD
MASYYFKRFATTYPRSEWAEEAMFMNAYSYFLNSPKSSLDQTNTHTAIDELTTFMDLYPYSDRIERCQELISQLKAKLMAKDFNIANLYYKMEDYEAAIATYDNVMKDYPDTEFKEEILFKILKSYYHFASNSISAKQEERFQSALDAYNELMFQFPETLYKKEADNIFKNIQKKVSNLEMTLNN